MRERLSPSILDAVAVVHLSPNVLCAAVLLAVLCSDTFINLQRWVDKITLEAEKNCAMILVGNKLDLVEANPAARRVPLDEAKRYGASVNAMVVEASAKSGDSIAHTFEQVVAIYFERAEASNRKQQTGTPASGSKSADLTAGGQTEKKKCCS